ncbi:MAG: hypothetical protein JSS67_06075 [Bacteroidetes bacterium]|nr:hypothetical protein [Bacteroidota bacterium]
MIPKISLIAFPQKHEGSTLFINVLSILRNYNPLTTTDLSPAWVNANMHLQAVVINALDDYPRLDLPATVYDLAGTGIPSAAQNIFTSLESRFKITKTANQADARTDMKNFQVMKKYLPQSYREAFNFTSARNKEVTVTGDEYHCAIKNNPDPDPNFGAAISDETSWGKIFAFCLRHKELAKKCGFIHELLEIKLADHSFKNGGWLYIDLHPDCSYFPKVSADPNFVKRYAARIPALDLTKNRDLFSAVVFPVLLNANPPGSDEPIAPSTAILDKMFAEAAAYDDGFCKIVHHSQPISNHLLNEEQDDESPVTSDIGIRLGWDDEQIAEWHARQMMEDPGTGSRADAPLGVFQYRVDVREKVKEGDPVNKWISLCNVKYEQDVYLDDEKIGSKNDELELGIDVYPTKPDQGPGSHFWLPAYFAQWIGKSLALQDEDAIAIYHKDEIVSNHLSPKNNYDPVDDQPFKATKNTFYQPAGLNNIQLIYGHEYEFRIRMSDITGGGPIVEMEPQYDAPSPITNCLFKRHVIPQQVDFISILPTVDTDFFTASKITLKRPLLGYPSVLFTGAYSDGVEKLIDDANNIISGNLKRGVGLPDPDVDTVEITVEVRSLALDTTVRKLNAKENFAFLYVTRRAFDPSLTSKMDLELNFIDALTLAFSGSTQLDDLGLNTSGNNDINQRTDLVLPTARDIRITVRAITKSKTDYYGGIDNQGYNRIELKGTPTTFMTRKAAKSEKNIFKATGEEMMIRGIYLQPEDNLSVTTFNRLIIENLADSNQIPTLMDRLSAAIGANSKGMSLIGREGQRWQFGVSRFIRNTASPDNTSITFSSKSDLLNHWIVPITLLINRDWSWDGIMPTSLSVFRRKIFLRTAMNAMGITNREEFLESNSTEEIFNNNDIQAIAKEELVGDITMKQAINLTALINADRSQTYACFIDAVEPKQENPQDFPDEIFVAYRIEVHFKTNENPTLKVDKEIITYLHLPITIPPAEVPKIVSAGISMSPYKRDEKYANTENRKKYLWIEFAEPLKNTYDTYFARVLNYAPDVLLAQWELDLFFAKKEPSLPLDPEYIRTISPSSSDDRAGLFAMQEMIPATDSKVHFILPLPPGMHTESLEMFGMYTYEFRVGHKIPWSTAHGRFGRALRSTGIQHPSPQLFCVPNRNEKFITVSAPYAQTVFDGRNVTNKPPRTEIWALLYAQVRMADDSDMRNILLSDRKLIIPEEKKTLYASTINSDATPQGLTGWLNSEVEYLLDQMGLPKDSPLSVLCVEMMPGYENFFITPGKRKQYEQAYYTSGDMDHSNTSNQIFDNKKTVTAQTNFKNYMGGIREGMHEMQSKIHAEYMRRYSVEGNSQQPFSYTPDEGVRPLTTDLGFHRILRTSTLMEVPEVCCTE